MLCPIQFLLVLASLFVAAASTVDCIVHDLKEVTKTSSRLECAVNAFHHCQGGRLNGLTHNLKPLAHIYKLSVFIDDQLDSLIDDVQCSCDFSADDSEQVLFTVGAASEPILQTLQAFKKKYCQFEESLGPGLTHRVIGGSLKRTRCLTLDMLRSIECRIDPTYKEIVASAQSEMDAAFQRVLCIY